MSVTPFVRRIIIRRPSAGCECVLIENEEMIMTYPPAIARAFRSSVIGALLLILGAGCGRIDTSAATTPLSQPALFGAQAGLSGTRWQLVAFENGAQATPVLTGTQVTAEFAGELLGGRSGCNLYEATVVVSGQNLKLLEVVETAVGCTNQLLMQQEDRYLAALRSTQSFQLVGDTLTIAYDGGALRFARMPPLLDCGPNGSHPTGFQRMLLLDCKPKEGTATTLTPKFTPTPATSP
jgi:heat shock protein HslJ